MVDDKKTPGQQLCEAVSQGLCFDAGKMLAAGEEIDAGDIRRLVLGLPVDKHGICKVTPAGIEIHGATIKQRVELDRVFAADGGPVAPIEFRRCYLAKGFSGARGHFRRISFKGCTFGDPDPLPSPDSSPPAGRLQGQAGAEDEDRDSAVGPERPPELIPTIDLSGAHIGSDLNLDEVAPHGLARDAADEPEEGPYLWIRLTGARLAGHLALSGSHLRAPEEPLGRGVSDLPIDALNLSLAELGGDVWFLHSTSDGGVSGRGLNLKGDIWMSGAHLRRPGRRGCLFLQSARIGGKLMLDGCEEKVGRDESFRRFVSVGEINLIGAQVGGYVILADFEIDPGQPDSGSAGPISLRMSGARIGNSVEIGKRHCEMSRLGGRLLFDRMEVRGKLKIEDVELGVHTPDPDGKPTIDATGLVADALTIVNASPLSRGDWMRDWFAPQLQWLSISVREATLGGLEVKGSRFTGPFDAAPIRCTDNALLHGRIGGEVDFAGAEVGGSLDISGLRMDPSARYLSFKGGTIGHSLRLARPRKPGALPPSLMRARRTRLTCLPETTLIETLWRYQDDEWRTRYHQAAFLERKHMYYLLDRRADVLGDFVKRHGHTIGDAESAREYFRLYCNYGPSELPLRWLVDEPDQLPPFAIARGEQNPKQGRRAYRGAAFDDRCLVAPLAGSGALAALGAIDYLFECSEGATTPGGRGFEIAALLICGDLLARGRFRLSVGDRHQVHIGSRSGPERGVRLEALPCADGQHLEHPKEAALANRWVTRSAFEGCVELDLEKGGRGPSERDRLYQQLSPYLSSGFSMSGRIDLRNLSCTTLEDRAGRLWGTRARIKMNHFTYQQAQWYPRTAEKKRSHRLLGDRWLATLAETLWPFRNGPRADRLRERQDFWEPWQVRRNWIYQQYADPPGETRGPPKHVAICRYRIDEQYYRPQPFEQAIRVARAEGREDFAIHFELLKQRIEWRLFNRLVRWWLGFLGIGLAALWLFINHGPETGAFLEPRQWGTLATLAVTLGLMIGASFIHSTIRKGLPWLPYLGSRGLTWIIFFIPPAVLFWFSDWRSHPFHFLVALVIFLVVRCLSYIAYLVMRFGFGYMRRPVRAVATLIVAFLLGWLGVHAANMRGMLVINAEPVAGLVRGHGRDGLMGIDSDASGARFVHNVPCGPTISEPLYALDVLIPLVDLREESRCEVRRVEDEGRNADPDASGRVGSVVGAYERPPPNPAVLSFWQLVGSIAGMTIGNFRFWWLMKALCAISGWFIVSLSILTFAQANRAHAEPPTEHK